MLFFINNFLFPGSPVIVLQTRVYSKYSTVKNLNHYSKLYNGKPTALKLQRREVKTRNEKSGF